MPKLNSIRDIVLCIAFFCFSSTVLSQEVLKETQIRGFGEILTTLQNDKVSFSLGEQDLFITSQLSDRFSFLGESVFKYTSGTPTKYSVSIERSIVKYNVIGNHNILVGKHHTPVNYWNDTYHHGRVFFPTIFRPLIFDKEIIPIHTIGIDFQGQNLGNVKFGYDLLIGNGIGSSDVLDNDKRKSITAAIHIKPVEGLRIGATWYNDRIAKGTATHDGDLVRWTVKQNLFTGSVAYFGDKFELLTEGTAGTNKTDTTGSQTTLASYIYAGIKIKEKLVPYFRLDNLHFQTGEIFFDKDNTTSIVLGIRYNVNYLTAIKLEYLHQHGEVAGNINKVTAQLAVGF